MGILSFKWVSHLIVAVIISLRKTGCGLLAAALHYRLLDCLSGKDTSIMSDHLSRI